MIPLEMQNKVKEATRSRTRYVYSLVNKDFLKIDVPVTKTGYKVAILFSGGLRNFYITQEWANKFLIDPLNADVFFHGWCNKNGIKNNEDLICNYHNLKGYKILDKDKTSLVVPEVLKNKFPDVVRQGFGLELADHILGQLFNIKQSFDLMENYSRENSITYDLVIRARPDVFWYASFEDKDLDFIAKNRCLATPQKYISVICGNNINDQFAMGQTDIMQRYTRMFDKVEEYGRVAPNDAATEFYVTHHIQKSMTDIFLYDIDMTFMLDYPIDYEVDKGFNHSTLRHVEQNDSLVARSVVNNITRRNQ